MRLLVFAGGDWRNLTDRFGTPTCDGGEPIHGMTAAAWTDSNGVALDTAEASDGSFAVLDGEMFSADAPVDGPDAAQQIVRDITAIGTDAIASWRIEGSAIVWMRRTGELWVIRDRMGVVPVYWSQVLGGVAVSTSLPDLSEAHQHSDVDICGVNAFVALGQIPAPWTFVRGVHKLPPGHILHVAGPSATPVVARWHHGSGRPKLALDDDELTTEMSQRLERAVGRRINDARSVGVLLSSGVDSNILAAIAAKRFGVALDAFTFRYTDYDGLYNEHQVAAEHAANFGIPHHIVDVAPSDIEDRFAEMVAAFGEPFAHGLHSFKLDEVRATGVDVILNGTQGFPWQFPATKAARFWRSRHLPGRGLTTLQGMTDLAAQRIRSARRFERVLRELASGYANAVAFTSPSQRRRLLGVRGAGVSSSSLLLRDALNSERCRLADERSVDRELLTSRQFLSPEKTLLWNNRWARVHRLRTRLPLVDADVVELVLRMRDRQDDKAEFRRAAKRYMPAPYAHERKIPQVIPVAQWLRGPLLDLMTDSLSERRLRRSGLLEPRAVHDLMRTHIAEAPNSARGLVLWSLMALTEWHLQLIGDR